MSHLHGSFASFSKCYCIAVPPKHRAYILYLLLETVAAGRGAQMPNMPRRSFCCRACTTWNWNSGYCAPASKFRTPSCQQHHAAINAGARLLHVNVASLCSRAQPHFTHLGPERWRAASHWRVRCPAVFQAVLGPHGSISTRCNYAPHHCNLRHQRRRL